MFRRKRRAEQIYKPNVKTVAYAYAFRLRSVVQKSFYKYERNPNANRYLDYLPLPRQVGDILINITFGT